MKQFIQKLSIMSALVCTIFLMSSSSTYAQTYTYRTTDQKYYIAFVKSGDSWTISTAEAGGEWVGTTTLHSDNKNGYYKAKSHRTGHTFEMWIKGTALTAKVLGADGQYYNWQYYEYK